VIRFNRDVSCDVCNTSLARAIVQGHTGLESMRLSLLAERA